ncbi:MAG: response regulator transcription factor [Myxococcota bacterium]
MTRVLLVEDDAGIAESTARGLRAAGFDVEHAPNGTIGRERALAASHDLVVLDLMLPGVSGYDVLSALREVSAVPVIVVTARTGLDPRMRSFDLGADDVLPKPFWVDELVARIRRRLGDARPVRRVVAWGDAVLDLDAHEVSVRGETIALTPSEYAVLAHLATRPGRAVSRQQLLEGALPEDSEALERTVDSHVARVRSKLGPAGAAVETVWRIGYRFVPG